MPKFQISLRIGFGFIRVVANRPKDCCFCGTPASWSLGIMYCNTIFSVPCCSVCYGKIEPKLPELVEKIKKTVWVPLSGEVPGYFVGGQFLRDTSLLAGLPVPKVLAMAFVPSEETGGWEGEQ